MLPLAQGMIECAKPAPIRRAFLHAGLCVRSCSFGIITKRPVRMSPDLFTLRSHRVRKPPRNLATAMDLGRKIGKISAMAGNGNGFVANRSRTPFGTEMNIMVEEGALPEQVDKVMADFRLSDRAICDGRSVGARHRLRQPPAARGADPELPQDTDRRCDRRGRAAGPEDRGRLVPLREGRPHPAPRPRGSPHHQREGCRDGGRAAQLHRRGDPAPAAKRCQAAIWR